MVLLGWCDLRSVWWVGIIGRWASLYAFSRDEIGTRRMSRWWIIKDEDGMDAAEIVDHCWNLCRLTEEWVAWVLWQRNHLKRRWFEGRLDKKGRGGKY